MRRHKLALLSLTVGLALLVVIVLDVAIEPGWAVRLREWAIAAASIILVLVTWQLVKATDVMAKATDQLAAETKRQYAATHRPRLRLNFLLSHHVLVSLTIENVGDEAALDARLAITPPMLGLNRDATFMDLPLFAEGARSINPGFRVEFVLGTTVDFLGDDPLPTAYVATVSYRSADRQEFQETIILDLGFIRGSLAAKPPYDEMMAESLKRLADRFDRAKDAHSSGILVATEGDVRLIRKEWEADRKRWQAEQSTAKNKAAEGDVAAKRRRSRAKPPPSTDSSA